MADKATIPLGFLPWGIAVNPVSGFVWVVVSGQDILQAINPATHTITKTLNHGTVRSYSPKEDFAKDGGYSSRHLGNVHFGLPGSPAPRLPGSPAPVAPIVRAQYDCCYICHSFNTARWLFRGRCWRYATGGSS